MGGREGCDGLQSGSFHILFRQTRVHCMYVSEMLFRAVVSFSDFLATGLQPASRRAGSIRSTKALLMRSKLLDSLLWFVLVLEGVCVTFVGFHSQPRHRSSCFEILEGIGLYRCTQVLRPGGPGAVAMSIRGHTSDLDSLHLGDPFGLMLPIDASMVSSNSHDQARSTNETSSYSVTEAANVFGGDLMLQWSAPSCS